MLKVQTTETFKNKLSTGNGYLASDIVKHDEPDHAIGSDVESGRNSLTSTNTFIVENKIRSQSQYPSAKVKVVGELLKKDVKCAEVANSTPFIEPILNGIDLSSLIIAKDMVIGGPPFSKIDSKCKKSTVDPNRKKRIQRVAEHIDAKQKMAGLSITKPSSIGEKTKPKEIKSVVRRPTVVRSNSKDSVNTFNSIVPDKTKKKLAPKLSLDSKTKEVKKDSKANGKLELRKPLNPSPASSPKFKNSDRKFSNVKHTTYQECYNTAMNRKCNSDWLDNSCYKDFSKLFPGYDPQYGTESALSNLDLARSGNSQVIQKSNINYTFC